MKISVTGTALDATVRTNCAEKEGDVDMHTTLTG